MMQNLQNLAQLLPVVLLLGILMFVMIVVPRMRIDAKQRTRLRTVSLWLIGISLTISLVTFLWYWHLL